MKEHEGAVDARLDVPAIERVKAAAKQKETIPQVAELFHSSARITIPAPAASSTFNNTNFVNIIN
jgi:hypothetical protein